MKNGSSGFECFSGYGDGGCATTDYAVALEELDFGGGSKLRGVFADEMGDGGTADSGSDDADGGRRWWCIGVLVSLGENKKGQQQRE